MPATATPSAARIIHVFVSFGKFARFVEENGRRHDIIITAVSATRHHETYSGSICVKAILLSSFANEMDSICTAATASTGDVYNALLIHFFTFLPYFFRRTEAFREVNFSVVSGELYSNVCSRASRILNL